MKKTVPSWDKISKLFEEMGWKKVKFTDKIKTFQIGKEKLVVLKIDGGWKIEYFSGNRLEDSSGIVTKEKFARLLAFQSGVLRHIPW